MEPLKGGLTILENMLHSLPRSEKKIAQYILNHPDESIFQTASALGEKSETSGAAVIRLCKSLGLRSFQELKLRIASDLQAKNLDEYRDIQSNENYKDIIGKVTSNSVKTINETTDINHSENLHDIVKTLIHANSIIFVGVGASYIAAKDAEQKFLRIGKEVHSFSDMHMAATVIANKGIGDVVVGISSSGNTCEVAKLLEIAKHKGAKTVSITKYSKSLVQTFSDMQLYTSASGEATFRSGATSSRMAQLHIIDMLFMCVASEEYDQTVQRIDATREAISFLKPEH